MRIAIPSATETIIDQTGNTNSSWFTFFQNIFRIVGGNYGIRLGGSLDINTTSISNTNTGETTLISYSLPADSMVNNGDIVEIQAWGIYAANGNSKTIKLKFGSQTILDTGAIAANGGSWSIKATIIRTSATTQEIITEIISSNSSVTDSSTRTAGTQTLSNANLINCTGQGGASNDITQYALITKLTPNI
jgi:hypothetical protein